MSETKQGKFDVRYHHIEAPTVQDDEYGKKFKKRKLYVPDASGASDLEMFRSPLLWYLSNNEWLFRRKLDGQNLRVQWDGDQVLWSGRTDNFIATPQLTELMNNLFPEEIFEEKFGRDKRVVLFGEHMGPKAQGNELQLEHDIFVLFDVLVGGTWLGQEDVQCIAHYFNYPLIANCYDFMGASYNPEHGGNVDTLRNLINAVADGDFTDWEGLVATPLCNCQDGSGNRVIVKIKNRDYLRDEGKL